MKNEPIKNPNYIDELFRCLFKENADLNENLGGKIAIYLRDYDVKDYDPSRLAKMLIADGVVKIRTKKKPSLLKNIIIPTSILLGVYLVTIPLEFRTEKVPYQDFHAKNVVYEDDLVKMDMEVDGTIKGVFDGSYKNWPNLEDLREGDRVTLRKVRALPLVTLVSEYLGLGKPIEWSRTSLLRINEREKR